MASNFGVIAKTVITALRLIMVKVCHYHTMIASLEQQKEGGATNGCSI